MEFSVFPEKIIPYDYDRYFSNPDRFVMVTTNCLTGKAEYLEEKSSSARVIVEYAMSQGYEKLVVVLTRNKGYRKPDIRMPLAKVAYRKYPNLQNALRNRNAVYNKTMDLIEKLEDEGKITVIRPTRPIEVSRMEKDTAKLAALYQEGYDIASYSK